MRRDVLRGLLYVGADIVTMSVAYFGMRSIGIGGLWPTNTLIALIALVFALLFAGRRPALAAISFPLLICLNFAAGAWTGITFFK